MASASWAFPPPLRLRTPSRSPSRITASNRPNFAFPANSRRRSTVKNLDATPEEFESKSLRIEKVIPGNSEATFTLRPLKAGRYKFVGEFHEDAAKGEVIAE